MLQKAVLNISWWCQFDVLHSRGFLIVTINSFVFHLSSIQKAEDSLYELPDYLNLKSSTKRSEDMLSNQMLSGIPEVDLGIEWVSCVLNVGNHFFFFHLFISAFLSNPGLLRNNCWLLIFFHFIIMLYVQFIKHRIMLSTWF